MTRAMTAAAAATNTISVTPNIYQEHESGTEHSGIVCETSIDAALVHLENSSGGSNLATDDIPAVIAQPILLNVLMTLKETHSQLDADHLRRQEVEAALQRHGIEQHSQLEAERQRRQEFEQTLQHRSTEEENLAAGLRTRDAELIESHRTIEELQAGQFSLQQQLAQIQQCLNQLSQNTTSNKLTHNIDTQGVG
jgi:predicted RNase H-like nuclease (RuvC/YqgF family)